MPTATPSAQQHRAARRARVPLAIAALLGAAVALPASAALGGAEASAMADASVLHGATRVESRTGYRVTHLTLPSGTELKEFGTPDGTIFAVSWRGIRPPAMSLVLGAYYADLQAAQAQHTAVTRGHLRLQTDRMVFESSAHMRDIQGRAYVSALVPAGVTVEDLR